MGANTKNLELLLTLLAMNETGDVLTCLYLMAIKHLHIAKEYCSIDFISFLFKRHWKIVSRDIKDLERRGLVYEKKGMITLSREGKQEVNRLIKLEAEAMTRITESMLDAKPIGWEHKTQAPVATNDSPLFIIKGKQNG